MADGARRRFRKPAALRGAGARLYAWGARALYVGPALGLSPHRNAVGVVAIGLDAPFRVASDPHAPSAPYRACRSAVIPPNTLHHFADTAGRMAFLYVDARSHDLARLRTSAGTATPRAAYDLGIEKDLVTVLRALADGTTEWPETRRMVDDMLANTPPRTIDPRVTRALARLHADPGVRPPLRELAREVALSESRLLHLFKEATGVPLRRYKLWVGMGAAMRAVMRGASLTTAALDAGFASSAHFSAAFREMFGLEPSRLQNVRTVRATSPAFIARKASLMSSRRPRRDTISSSFRRPCR